MSRATSPTLPTFHRPIPPSFHPSLFFLTSFLCLLLCMTARGQDAMVRASLATNDTMWVGGKVTLNLDLLAPGYFAGAANFDLPDPSGVLLMPPTGRPVIGSETIDGTNYSVQRHRLSVFPTRTGQQEIPSFEVRFRFKRTPLDTNEISATVTTTNLPFTVNQPPGAENLGLVISARDLRLAETWTPDPGQTNVPAGSAFTRTITFSAPEVPGMVFPPFPAGDIDGLGIYTKRQLRDQSSRGSLQGERRDVITYVCERPGTYTIPAVRFVWFDLESQQLRTNDLPERNLLVTTNSALASAETSSTSARTTNELRENAWWLILGAVIAGIFGFAFARSARLRGLLRMAIHPFKPIHLAPFNPTTDQRRQSPPES